MENLIGVFVILFMRSHDSAEKLQRNETAVLTSTDPFFQVLKISKNGVINLDAAEDLITFRSGPNVSNSFFC